MLATSSPTVSVNAGNNRKLLANQNLKLPKVKPQKKRIQSASPCRTPQPETEANCATIACYSRHELLWMLF